MASFPTEKTVSTHFFPQLCIVLCQLSALLGLLHEETLIVIPLISESSEGFGL